MALMEAPNPPWSNRDAHLDAEWVNPPRGLRSPAPSPRRSSRAFKSATLTINVHSEAGTITPEAFVAMLPCSKRPRDAV
jgi:hypothetical protein